MRLIMILIVAFCLDSIFGDPHYSWHPICLIGRMIAAFESVLRKMFSKTRSGELAAGLVMVIAVLLVAVAVPVIMLYIAGLIHSLLGICLEIIFCYQLLAARSLQRESMKVYRALDKGDIEEARRAVAMIVGRDTQHLDKEGITRAAVETVAENASDGVIAPLIYMAVGGAAFGFLYKAINTMDSMAGYKNDRYLYFGRAAAKLDDIVNFLPSRIAGLLFVAAAAVMGEDARGSWRIFRRDRHKHASPNSAQTESACAGALGVRLAGDAYYFGQLHKKDYIGDYRREIEPRDIVRANSLMYTASILCLLICIGIRILIMIFLKS